MKEKGKGKHRRIKASILQYIQLREGILIICEDRNWLLSSII